MRSARHRILAITLLNLLSGPSEVPVARRRRVSSRIPGDETSDRKRVLR